MKKISIKCVSILIIIVMGASLFGCGGNGQRGGENDFARYFNDRSLFYGQTLTVANFLLMDPTTPTTRLNVFAQVYMAQNPGVTIEIVNPIGLAEFGAVEGTERYREYMSLRLMAGTAPTLFEATGFDWRDMRVNQHFADWLPIMQADPRFNEDDFQMEVVNVLSENAQGRLVIYPAMYQMRILLANTGIPGLAEAVSQMDTLSSTDLIRLNNEFNADGEFHISASFNAPSVTMMNLAEFLDMDNLVSDFNNPRFIEMISQANDLSCPDVIRYRAFFPAGGNFMPHHEEDAFRRFMFKEISLSNNPFFFGQHQGMFASPRPLADYHGRALIDPHLPFAISATASPIQQALAWDFIQFMQTPHPMFMLVTAPSLFRPILWDYLETQAAALLFNRPRVNVDSDLLRYVVSPAYTVISSFADLPLAFTTSDLVAFSNPGIIDTIIVDALRDFEDGLITAHAAAELIQNRITIVLMEMD
ncbi:MAG: hypothetical protein FWB71_03905 [Defluviitaleaceae bacterium]|nr:hypothetical protein [Defluviitaleaceae bacterium]